MGAICRVCFTRGVKGEEIKWHIIPGEGHSLEKRGENVGHFSLNISINLWEYQLKRTHTSKFNLSPWWLFFYSISVRIYPERMFVCFSSFLNDQSNLSRREYSPRTYKDQRRKFVLQERRAVDVDVILLIQFAGESCSQQHKQHYHIIYRLTM